jgi:demethylmenaquinone methyltransferase/2-methoxy-6-polyprenyl-1,4-benzoquinol methylase
MTYDHFPILPINRSKQSARRSYDQLSRWYDILAGSSEQKFRNMGLNLLNAQPGENILEIGCGTGSSLLTISEQVQPDGVTLGLDLSKGMLNIASKKLKKARQFKYLLLNADGINIPTRSSISDAIFVSFTLELFEIGEINLLLNQCKRILKPAGRLAIVSMALTSKLTLMSRLYNWAHINFPEYCDCRPIPTAEILLYNGFTIKDHKRSSMWGLPVDIILATF